jgi:hypothetical protein
LPNPHFDISIVQRSKGKSAVAGAAYQSGEKLFSEYDQTYKDYRNKHGIVYTEILLPPNAPPEYADRATLWNAAEEVEKQWNSQLARRFVLALPREIPSELYPQMVRDYCEEHFVSKGMCCDFAIHDPHPPGHNPHCHVILTMRAMDEHGKWLPKTRKVYDLDENGERIRLPSGNWKSHKEDTVDWNEQYHGEEWRHGWEVVQNRYLEMVGSPERVDLRSYERQGLDIIPTVHMGPAVTQMERRGITVKESRGRLSYLTPDRTKAITARKLGDDFDKTAVFAAFVRNAKQVKTKTPLVHSAPTMQDFIKQQNSVSRVVDMETAKTKGRGYENWAKKYNLKNASRAYVLYQEMGFDSPEALAAACDAAHTKVDDIRTKMKFVETAIKDKKEFRDQVTNYHKTRYVVDELKACKNEKARQKDRDDHDSDFIILNAAKRYFDSKGLKKLPSHKALQTEVEQLIKEKNELYNQYQTAKEEAQRLETIRHNLEQHLGRKIEHKKEQER